MSATIWTKIKNFIASPKFEDAEKTRTAKILYAIITFTIIGNVFTLIAANVISSGPTDNTSLYVASTGVILIFLVLLGLTRLGYVGFSSWVLVASSFIGLHYILWNGDGLHDLTILAYSMIIALGGLLLGKQAIIVSTILAFASMFGLAYGEANGQIIPSFSNYDYLYLIRYSAPLFLTSFVLYITIHVLFQSRNQAQLNEQTAIQKNRELEDIKANLELLVAERTAELEESSQQLQKRAGQFEAIAQLARTISSIQELEKLLPRITQMISRQFNFYHVGLFLLDESNQYAVLSAANSEGGQRMLARKHRLGVGQTGIVGYVTSTGNPRIALDTGADTVFFDNPDLPETRSEMALPLRVGKTVVGALDVQSTEPNAFTEDDVEVLSILADVVSVAIENARLFEESQRVLTEAQTTLSKSILEAWQQISKKRQLVGYELSGASIRPLENPLKSVEIRKAKKTGQISLGPDGKKTTNTAVAVPIKLRDRVIGTINISLPDNREWDPDEVDITQALAERVGVAIENATLLEESRRRATMESVIGDISAKISASTEVERIMQVAAGELRKALSASEVVFKIGVTEEG
ncbi:MAG: GAF domain-containing protein [Anaerolineales bacterium]|nr:GAF domain-containing protein [Anaerolineales bacterium]